MKLPRILQDKAGVNVLEYELFQEKASTLARMGAKLKIALDALAAYDAAHEKRADDAGRAELVAEAGEMLWWYVVQREVCGLRDTQAMMRSLGVPREVQLKMGMRPKKWSCQIRLECLSVQRKPDDVILRQITP